jgi:hypothetical protein
MYSPALLSLLSINTNSKLQSRVSMPQCAHLWHMSIVGYLGLDLSLSQSEEYLGLKMEVDFGEI